jgi:hypothetical protein
MSRALLAAALLLAPLTGCRCWNPPERASMPSPEFWRGELRAAAVAFMSQYADDLRAGDRARIAARYDRRGAWRVGDGLAQLDTWDSISAVYASERWQPPAAFEWQDLAYELAGQDSVVVIGRFAWTPVAGQPPMVFSYTALLVMQEGALRIRLENESGR